MQAKQQSGRIEELTIKTQIIEKELHRLSTNTNIGSINLKSTTNTNVEEYQTIYTKLQTANTKIDHLEKIQKNLQDENSTLSIRAMTRFGDLTPRFKNFSEVFEHMGIEKPNTARRYIKHIQSTEYINSLINHIQNQKRKIKELMDMQQNTRMHRAIAAALPNKKYVTNSIFAPTAAPFSKSAGAMKAILSPRFVDLKFKNNIFSQTMRGDQEGRELVETTMEEKSENSS